MSQQPVYQEKLKSKFHTQQPFHHETKQTERYRPGQLPEYARDVAVDQYNVIDYGDLRNTVNQKSRGKTGLRGPKSGKSSFEAAIVEDDEDVKQEFKEEEENVWEQKGESDESEEDEEEADRRRELARQRYLQKQAQQQSEHHIEKKEGFEARIIGDEDEMEDDEDDGEGEGDGEEEEEDDDEEYETDSEEEKLTRIKPKFVPRQLRGTIAEKEKQEQEQLALEEKQKLRAEERKQESHQKVVEVVRKEEEMEKLGQNPDTDIAFGSSMDVDVEELNIPNDDDNINEEEEYENWKIRELKRIKHDKEEVEKEEQERLDIERRRKMTDQEIRQENLKLGIGIKKDESKYKFMQKYYHKGAFFMDTEDNIYQRDYNMPTLEDKFDKEVLRPVQQVKNFGRSGRTKWTHLLDNDTSVQKDVKQRDSLLAPNQNVQAKILSKMGGLKSGFERPSGKKKAE